jgi:leukotriene-A4 hydrolase
MLALSFEIFSSKLLLMVSKVFPSRSPNSTPQIDPTAASLETDPHSFSNPERIKIRHIDLELTASFAERTLHGFAELTLDRFDETATELVLDTMALRISRVEYSANGSAFAPAQFQMGSIHPILGTPMRVELPRDADRVRIEYFTDPNALGLQWLDPQQTSGGKQPFFLTQSQTIYARSWLPLQDSPQVRMTFRATVHCPENLLAVMGAANNPATLNKGLYHFEMPQPIPSYLMALAIGDFVFKPLGPRSGVYAEASAIELAASEFADIELIMSKVERLYGPYRWDRYDLLVLPPSFPLGGMENPRLTFVTPTILVGDKSLVSLIAHELAHSWAGNLVTNATWSDFWLNEGFSVYVERRIVEEIYGRRRAELESSFGRQKLEEEILRLSPRNQALYANCQDPEECVTEIPYEKGALFLVHLEKTFGRERFDEFLRGYFDHFAFQSIRTSDFVDYLTKELLFQDPRLTNSVPVAEWIYEPGLPESAPKPFSEAAAEVRNAANLWFEGVKPTRNLEGSSWTPYEWLHFLKSLPPTVNAKRLQELDNQFNLTGSPNSEIAHEWLLLSIRTNYEPAAQRLEDFLISIGREKLIKPLYEELAESKAGLERARTIYSRARPGYHPLVVKKIDRLLSGQK